MKDALDGQDVDIFGEKIARVWELNKILDLASSNDDIESILESILRLIHGSELLGGGGGFLFMVTKGREQARKIKEMLNREPPSNGAHLPDFEADQKGLRVSVLEGLGRHSLSHCLCATIS